HDQGTDRTDQNSETEHLYSFRAWDGRATLTPQPGRRLISPRSPARSPATPRPDPPARRARTPARESGRSARPPATAPRPGRRDAAATYAAEDPAAYAAGSRRELIRPLRLRRLTDARRLTLTNGTVA